MAKKGYFAAAWGDIVNSPQWFSKFLKLALISFIPVFGIIVVYGYFYGWARDIAWNVHRPMERKIFDNSNGNLCKRGIFILIITFVLSLVPAAFSIFFNTLSGLLGLNFGYTAINGGILVSFIAMCACAFLSVLIQLFIYVGSMRASIYGTLSSGFQLNKCWSMIRYDLSGLVRIFLMQFAISLVSICIFFFAFSVSISIVISLCQATTSTIASIAVIFLTVIFFCFIALFVFVFEKALVSRALGYWVRQFDVPQWGGQEDFLPFEKGIPFQ